MSGKLSSSRVQLLQLLICSESTILAKVQTGNSSSKETAKKVQITEDGSVIFYYGSGPCWWQRLFGTYETVSIIDASIRIADAITGSNGTRNNIAFDGITQSILDEAVKKRDFDCVVDILFDTMRNCSDGELHSKYINQENIKRYAKEKKIQGTIMSDPDLFGYVGIRTSDGRTLPVRLGRVIYNL